MLKMPPKRASKFKIIYKTILKINYLTRRTRRTSFSTFSPISSSAIRKFFYKSKPTKKATKIILYIRKPSRKLFFSNTRI